MNQLERWFDASDLVSFSLGVVSTLIAIIAFLSQRGISLRSLDYQRRQIEIDEARRRDELRQVATADIQVTIQRKPRTTSKGKQSFSDYLAVTNTGSALACNVQLESLLSKPTGDNPIVADKRSIFPVQEIHAGATVTTPVMIHGGMGSYFEAVVSWEDGRGHQSKTQTVTISR